MARTVPTSNFWRTRLKAFVAGIVTLVLFSTGCMTTPAPAPTVAASAPGETDGESRTPAQPKRAPAAAAPAAETPADPDDGPGAGPSKVTSAYGITAWSSLDDIMPRVFRTDGELAGPPDDELLSILYRYSPDAYSVVREVIGLPAQIWPDWAPRDDEPFFGYITAPGGFDLLDDLLVAVHEEDHVYTAKAGDYWLSRNFDSRSDTMILYENGRGAATPIVNTYFVDRRRSIPLQVPYSNPPTAMIAPAIPARLRTFRFEAYVTGTSSTQDQGIYGLLDEYNAYRLTLQVAYDLFDYVRDEMEQTAETWEQYVMNFAGYLPAWSEFRFWILTYLLMLEQSGAEYFTDVMNDDRFRDAFTEIDDAYIDLQSKMIHRFIDDLPARLASMAVSTRFERLPEHVSFTGEIMPEYAIRLDESRGDPTSLGLHEYLRLTEVLATPRYLDMANRLRVRDAPALPPYRFEILEESDRTFRLNLLVVAGE